MPSRRRVEEELMHMNLDGAVPCSQSQGQASASYCRPRSLCILSIQIDYRLIFSPEDNYPDPRILAFFDFLAFFVFQFSSLFCVCFFFSKDFKGFRKENNPCFFGVSLAFFKKARVGGSGQFKRGKNLGHSDLDRFA